MAGSFEIFEAVMTGAGTVAGSFEIFEAVMTGALHMVDSIVSCRHGEPYNA